MNYTLMECTTSKDNSQALIIKLSVEVGVHSIFIFSDYQHTNAK